MVSNIINFNTLKIMEVKEVVAKLLANGSKKISGIRVKNVNVKVEDSYTRVSLTLDKKVEGYVENQTTGQYEKSETNVIFVSLYSIGSMFKENPDYAFAAGHIIKHVDSIIVLLSGATIELVQEPVIAGQEYTNPWSERTDKEAKTFEHDTIINHIVGISLSDFGLKRLDRLGDQMLGF